MENKICPKCKSKNIKKIGPFAKLKREGEPAEKETNFKQKYGCLDCGFGREGE